MLYGDFPLFSPGEKNYFKFFLKLESLIGNKWQLKKQLKLFFFLVFTIFFISKAVFALKLKSIKQLQIFKTVTNVIFIHCMHSTICPLTLLFCYLFSHVFAVTFKRTIQLHYMNHNLNTAFFLPSLQKDFTLPVALITHLWVFFFLLFYPSVKMIDIKAWQSILFSHYYLSKVLDRSTFID